MEHFHLGLRELTVRVHFRNELVVLGHRVWGGCRFLLFRP
jgi:hypothetical protein